MQILLNAYYKLAKNKYIHIMYVYMNDERPVFLD